jgi:hypothetical protein
MRRAPFWALACVGLSLLAGSSRAGAQANVAQDLRDPRVEAAERFDRGVRLVNAGDLSGGLAEFQRAYALGPLPVVLYNVGLVYAALHRPVDAARALAQAIVRPDALRADYVERARTVLREQLEQIGQVTISTNVRGGRVEVDNVEVAQLPLDAPLDVASGAHVMGVVAPGYAPGRKEVVVAARERVEVRLELIPIQGLLAHIAVRSRVPAADVFVDGGRVGKTPLEATVSVPPGPHHVEVRRAGYTTAARDVDLQEGAAAELTLEPVVDPAALAVEGGWMDIRSSEQQAVLRVDGEDVGLVGDRVRVPAGPHRIHLERAEFFAAERDVDVPRGGSLDVPIVFVPTPEMRVRYVAGAQSRRTWSWIAIGTGVALAAGGVTLALVEQAQIAGAQSNYDAAVAAYQAGSHQPCDPMAPSVFPYPDVCVARAQDALTRLNSLETTRTIGWVLAGAGATALVTGAVLLFTGDDPHRYDSRPAALAPSWHLVPAAGAGGAFLLAGTGF